MIFMRVLLLLIPVVKRLPLTTFDLPRIHIQFL